VVIVSIDRHTSSDSPWLPTDSDGLISGESQGARALQLRAQIIDAITFLQTKRGNVLEPTFSFGEAGNRN
jgi:hypothetical protein